MRSWAAAPTYNLSVEETATYFVGDGGVLAHNTSACAPSGAGSELDVPDPGVTGPMSLSDRVLDWAHRRHNPGFVGTRPGGKNPDMFPVDLNRRDILRMSRHLRRHGVMHGPRLERVNGMDQRVYAYRGSVQTRKSQSMRGIRIEFDAELVVRQDGVILHFAPQTRTTGSGPRCALPGCP